MPAQDGGRLAEGRKNIALMFLSSTGQRLRDCWQFRVGGEELQHPLVLLGPWHDFRRRIGDTHAHRRPVDISSGQEISEKRAL